jgi:hypothetical protein
VIDCQARLGPCASALVQSAASAVAARVTRSLESGIGNLARAEGRPCYFGCERSLNRNRNRSRDVSKQPPPRDADWPAGAVFTVGHSTLPIDNFVALLAAYGIERLADVRTVPRSRRNPQFNADALPASLREAGIEYVPLGELGGLRKPRPDSPNTGWRNASFRGYADYMQTEAFGEGLERLVELSRERRTAIMCAEAVPWRCHRSLVADALLAREIPVVEILSATSYRDHTLTPFAHVAGTAVTYPPAQERLL